MSSVIRTADVPQWEYMCWRGHDFHSKDAYLAGVNEVDVQDRTRLLAPLLDQAGEEGWELVNAAPIGQGGVGVLYFKRLKAQD
jgi:hypothetical protein